MENKLRLAYLISYSLALILLLSFLYYPSVTNLVDQWLTKDEYSHGPLLVLISLFIVWKKRTLLHTYIANPSWFGPLIIVFGLIVMAGSVQADITTITNYSLIIVLLGLSLSLGGILLLKELLFPIFLLFLTIPLPYLLNVLLTSKLQIISSVLGAWFIRIFNIPVYLEGNIIELGTYTLLVEEACSGLNYLYALVSIGFIWSYFFKAPILHKALLVISTIPIAIFMNSARIGVTGILVNTHGIEAAEGFLHEFEGWIIFLATCFLLIPVVWLLTLLQKTRPSASESIDVQIASKPINSVITGNTISPAALAGLGLIFLASLTTVNNNNLMVVQDRKTFSTFPSQLGDWDSTTQNLPSIIQDVLRADDYFLGDFNNNEGDTVNLYLVYYERQLNQKAIHSPLVCLPGGGWEIKHNDTINISPNEGNPILLNKLIINQDGNEQLVYYWIQQQGRSFANEYLARASLISTALTNKRTDGALVRITTPVLEGKIKRSEDILDAFLDELAPHLPKFIPN